MNAGCVQGMKGRATMTAHQARKNRSHAATAPDAEEKNSEAQAGGDSVQTALVVSSFNYDLLEAKVAEQVRSSAETIRQQVRNTLENAIKIGEELLAVKGALHHGQFLPWLRAEFGWAERTARNFMAVAEQFGKSAIIADLPIAPTAAYLLAAPSVPDEARQVAVEMAEAGETISVKVAKKIVAETKKEQKSKKTPKAVPAEKIGERLRKLLDRHRQQWDAEEMAEVVKQLRELADELEEGRRGSRPGKRNKPKE